MMADLVRVYRCFERALLVVPWWLLLLAGVLAGWVIADIVWP